MEKDNSESDYDPDLYDSNLLSQQGYTGIEQTKQIDHDFRVIEHKPNTESKITDSIAKPNTKEAQSSIENLKNAINDIFNENPQPKEIGSLLSEESKDLELSMPIKEEREEKQISKSKAKKVTFEETEEEQLQSYSIYYDYYNNPLSSSILLKSYRSSIRTRAQ